MGGAVDIPRAQDGTPTTYPAWKPVTLASGKRAADVWCANGHLSLLSTDPEGHVIAASGIVVPSIDCPRDNCSWHVYGTLTGWAECWAQASQPATNPLDPRREQKKD